MRVMVVDDHVLFRDGLVMLLNTRPGYTVVGEAANVADAVEKARSLKPDLILMDFNLPDGDGIEATQAILSNSPQTKIVFLTVSDDDEDLLLAIRAGARGYILKNVSAASLFGNLQAVENGELALSRTLSSRLINSMLTRTEPNGALASSPLAQLTPRERNILAELANGASNDEIAARLYLSPNTVKHHIHSLLAKLGVRNRHEAAQLARQHKI